MKTLLSILAVSHLLVAGALGAAPNIVFFLTDDQRHDTLGCAGHPIVQTPHIDGLAKDGVRFSNACVTTSICAASRASILTGLHERTHGFTFGTPPVSAEHILASYPAVLKKHGYRTGFSGKFGIGIAQSGETRPAMFDEFKSIGRNPYHKKQPDGSTRHETELNGDFAVEFIESNPEGKPFCLSISFNASHAEDGDKRPGIGHFPWPKAVNGLYDDLPMPSPALGDPKYFQAAPEFLRKSMNRDRFYWRWDTPEKYQTNLRAYFRMLTGIDNVIGRVRKALEAADLAENTIIVYSADNGYYMGDRGFAGKWSHYEQSLRVPLVIFDPRQSDNRGKTRVVDAPVLNIDLAPTFLAMAGHDAPTHYQGHSLVPFVEGRTAEEWRTDSFHEHLMNHRAIPKWEGVREERYVYAHYFQQDPPNEMLHDLKEDPEQLTNFASDPAYRDTLERLRARCLELRDSYGGAYQPPAPKKKRTQ